MRKDSPMWLVGVFVLLFAGITLAQAKTGTIAVISSARKRTDQALGRTENSATRNELR